MNSVMRNRERGIALLVVLFALLLLSVIGLGMMYSTNMETAINSNYRDKQVALYAALAGLQEARDRIQPATHNIVAPTFLPTTLAQNIIYIVSDYATVKPWLLSSPYFDTELCQQHILTLTGMPGVPCATIASGTTWFQYVDDSDPSSAPWNLGTPLDLKWVRIELKGNNMTPVAVNGNNTNTDQTCWTGVYQMSTPTGYTTGCEPVGGVTSVYVVTSGSGYTSAPVVNFAGGGGTGAVATAVLEPELTGFVASVTVTTGGMGYTLAPTVTFSSGSATATAVLSTTGTVTTTGGSVTGVTVDAGGSGYTSAPTVAFGGPGAGATAIAVLSSSGTTVTTGYVNSLTLTAPGSNYTTAPTVGFTGGGGSGATATATLSSAGSVKTITLDSVGTQCYSAASDVNVAFTGGGGTGAAATATLEAGRSCIFSWTVPASPQCSNKLIAANGYNPIDQKAGVTFQDVGNQSFSGTLFVSNANDKSPSATSTQNPGYDAAGYAAANFTSKLQLSGGPWADCGNVTATVTTGYRIASINVTSGGSGYTSTPTVTITGGVGSTSNPTASATRGFPISALNLTAGGTNYTSVPGVTITGGGGTGGAATATILTASTTTYPVIAINVTAGGLNYTSAPSVTLSGGGGTGAAGTASVALTSVTTYPVQSITVTSGGTGYDPSIPPTVTLSGGGGIGAAATAVLGTTPSGTYWVDHIDVNATGTGYTSNPTVTLTGGSGSGATATAQVSGGTKYGKVWLLTSFAQTKTGARSMLQQEVASPVMGFALGGALTLDGPNPIMDAMPNSNPFRIQGNDANTCSDAITEPDHPAIDGYDDPDANPATHSVATIIDSLPRPDHYTGSGGTPSVQNGFASLGETMTTPAGLQAVIGSIYNAMGSHHYDSSNVGTFDPTATTTSSINYVDGDLNLGGSNTGRGILVVTGTLTMHGNFSWLGLVFVVGDGHVEFSGGGNGQIVGSLFVSKIWDSYVTKNLLSRVGSPIFHWNGGGGNGIQYDHCLASNLMTAIPPPNYVSTKPLKILSTRILPY